MPTPDMPASLDEAMAIFQANLPSIVKDETAKVPGKDGKQGFTYGYAGLDTVSEKVLRQLGALGVSWRTRPTLDESGKFVLAYRLRHINGDEEVGTWPIAPGTPQQMGSAITYARRYALMAVTGVFPTNEDDDGAAASTRPARQDDDWERATPARPAKPSREQLIDAGHKAVREAASVEVLEALRHRVDGYALANEITDEDALSMYAAINGREAELTGNVAPAGPADPGIRDHQRRKLFALFAETGRNDRAAQMELLRQVADRPLESRNDLTSVEADAAIKVLEDQKKQGAGNTNGRSVAVA